MWELIVHAWVNCSFMTTSVETCSFSDPFSGTSVVGVEGMAVGIVGSTAVGAWDSCRLNLQGHPSSKKCWRSLGSLFSWHLGGGPFLASATLVRGFCSSILLVTLSRKLPPNKVISFTLSLVSSKSSGGAPMLGLTRDHATHLHSWLIEWEALC